ncbi:ABC transporter ATP-binding protein [Thioclava atlantica]|uniref:Putative amino acid ABC transporter, ATP-binding protein n=1 Tax=Thioclava atlantica TaxID=1317124 RepID=A0A085TSX1_9RHOB|nr:ABC transporter ATP-binding protein [Thioclava atlantica]KFE33818.1 putative amino acid ABC transporter, ATP-binding protein [Thioclava atlantica]
MEQIETTRTAGLRLNRLYKSFGGLAVLKDINLDIESGEFVVFVGPSGCGKSTLLRLIAGLEEVTARDVFIGSKDVTERDPSERGIAMVFQTYALYPHMSVAENMGFGLKAAKRSKQEVERKVRAAAEVLQLSQYLDRRPSQLSGGQRQRVAIGRAIVRDPEVFLFDEPLSNLDAELRVEMRIEIARLHRELGNTMIYVTHDQTEAMTLADKIVVLRNGEIEQVGPPALLYDDPDNTFVAGFIGSPKMNFVSAERANDGHIRIGSRNMPGPDLETSHKGALTLGIRPEHLRIARENEPCFPMRVHFSEFLGGVTYLYGDLESGTRCTVEIGRGISAEPGDLLHLTTDSADMRLFDGEGRRLR